MYQVLYRKWRPQVFADVAGQPQVTTTLRNELTAGRIAHAYLFTGSRGTGKTTCAKILAKAVNCLHPVDGDPCGECEICRGIDSGSVMDIMEIDAASNNGVDSIRNLCEEAAFTPAMARYRVYIIDEVHMLSPGAYNALLKTLEEPPPHVLFILATTEVHKLPATILSRCQRFDFHRIAPEDIAARLQYVAEHENASLEEQAGLLIARLSDGALRDALSLLDQCLGHSCEITVQVVNETAGLAGRDHLFGLTQAIMQKNSAAALEIVDRLYRDSKDMARLCEELIDHFRGMMLVKTMKDASALLAMAPEEQEKLSKQALAAPLSMILHGLTVFQESLERMYHVNNQRVEMEMSLIRLCSPELEDSSAALVRRIAALERLVQSGIPAQTAAPAPPAKSVPEPVVEQEKPAMLREEEPAPSKEPAPAPVKKEPAPQPSAKPVSMEEIQANARQLEEWPEILQILRNYSQSIAAAFHGSSAYVSGSYVLIDAPQELAFELLRKSSQRDKMRDAIRQVTGKVYKLGPYKPTEGKEAEQQDPLAALTEQARQVGIDVIEKN